MSRGDGREDWTPFQSRLGMVRLVLSVVWDPIGVFGHKATLDEYDRYAGRVLEFAKQTKSAERIAEFLAEQEEESMGLRRNTDPARMLTALRILQILENFED